MMKQVSKKCECTDNISWKHLQKHKHKFKFLTDIKIIISTKPKFNFPQFFSVIHNNNQTAKVDKPIDKIKAR